MGENSGGASPPRSKDEDELETLWTEYAAYCTNLRNAFPLEWLADRVLKRLRIEPSGALGVLTNGLGGGLPTLALALVVAAASGQWTGAPIWRWVIVSLWIALNWMAADLFGGASIEEEFSMDRALTKPADLRRLIAWAHRWITPRMTLVFGASYALVCLAVVGLFAGSRSFVLVPAGSMALLAFVFYFSGEVAYISLLWAFGVRLASELDYRVSWPSPLDSPWIRPALRGQARNEFERGLVVTGNIVVVAVLLSLTSPLLLPATIVLLTTGYAIILASIVAARRMFRRIVTRAKQERLTELQTRIDAFGERPAELEEAQFAELTRLLELRDIIDRSPTDLRARDGLARLVTSLALPTLTFVATVVAEEYFGRWAGRFLP